MKVSLWISLLSFMIQLISMNLIEAKRILLIIFPGGKSHHFILKELLNYTVTHSNYEFHIICHNYDKNLWQGTNHYIYDYGNIAQYENIFQKGLEAAKEDPIFGYFQLHDAMIDSYQSFLDEKVTEKLKKFKFELIISDYPNYLSKYLKKELEIRKSMYFTPTCSPSVFYGGLLEINPSYVPLLGSIYTEKMTFIERTLNTIQFYLSKVFFKVVMMKQKAFFERNNITVSLEGLITKSVFLSQCTDGVHYSMPLPRNADNIGAVLPKKAEEIKDLRIINFLEKFEKNIYFSQGTIVKIIDFKEIQEIFQSFPDVGFILSFKKEFIENHSFPLNVLPLEWVPQNDLLGHPKISAFITHGGLNSLLESIYHAKPIVCIGVSIDQVNNAALVEYRKIGVKFSRTDQVTKANLIDAINEVLTNNEMKKNIVKLSQIIQSQNPKKKFFEWIQLIVEVGYENLIVDAYLTKNFIQLNNLDVWFFIIACVWGTIKIFKFFTKSCGRDMKIKTE